MNALAIGLFYVLVLSSWIGYRKSIYQFEHHGFWGNSRFIIEFIIMFFFFYLLRFINPAKDLITGKSNFEYFGDTFLWGLPVIFGLFLYWDIIKFLEYKGDTETPSHSGRILITVIFFCTCIVQAVAWGVFNDRPTKDYASYFSWFIIVSIVGILLFRIAKWNDEISDSKRF